MHTLQFNKVNNKVKYSKIHFLNKLSLKKNIIYKLMKIIRSMGKKFYKSLHTLKSINNSIIFYRCR